MLKARANNVKTISYNVGELIVILTLACKFCVLARLTIYLLLWVLFSKNIKYAYISFAGSNSFII
jgi:hypothetical protein